MIRRLLLILSPVALVPAIVSTGAAAAARPPVQTLLFDAVFTRSQTAGPGPTHAGHRQIASGILRDADGRRIGTFSFTCTWTRVGPSGASESCAASAPTSDGRLTAAGPAQSRSVTHTWRLTGGTGLYRDASGQVGVRDLGDRESLITVTVTTPDTPALHAGKVTRPAVNRAFIARADGLCRQAAAALDALPRFPFASFDPLHPGASVLPAVGAFFTGPGDPRPILRALDSGLHALGQPPLERGDWRQALHARDHALAVIGEQDRAALAGNVPAFVRSVHQSAASFRQIALTATVFGATRCVL